MPKSPRTALLSVTVKDGLAPFAEKLAARGWQLLSTGGTAAHLREKGIPIREVSDFTGAPEILGGRVKTLHPKIHGGILMDREDPMHQQEASKNQIAPIDLVVVNLYDFLGKAAAHHLPPDEAIHHIDVGGPTMLRAAAKNFKYVWSVIDPADYDKVLGYLDDESPAAKSLRLELAQKVFATLSRYDGAIAQHFAASAAKSAEKETDVFPPSFSLSLTRKQSLRYGENPQQPAGWYIPTTPQGSSGLEKAEILQGKELSYNNLLDLSAAAELVQDFGTTPACTIIKHTNPCGVAAGDFSTQELFARALSADSLSAFGGIVAFNTEIDKEAAQAMADIFLECIVAPSFTPEASAIFAKKKNLRLLCFPALQAALPPPARLTWRSILGGMLAQTSDAAALDPSNWRVVTTRSPSGAQAKDLLFAETVAKHVKSNAIVYVRDGKTLGIGAGQMSRIDAVRFGAEKCAGGKEALRGAAVASDAFFPFRDSVDALARLGVTAIIQPGGSLRDEESIQAANEHGLTMVFTGQRHFRH